MTPDWQLPPGTDRGSWDYVNNRLLAETYDARLAGTPLLDLDLRFAEQQFRKPGRLVDLGCGTGRLLIPLARRGFTCLGVDLSAGMLDEVSKKAAAAGVRVETLQANLVELDVLPDAIFDYAACLFSTLGMLRGRANRGRFLQHAFRILKPGGTLVVHVHNCSFRAGFGLGRRGSEPGDRKMPQAIGGADLTLHHFSKAEIFADLNAAQFQIGKCLPVSLHPDGRLPWSWLLPAWRTYGYLIAAFRPVSRNLATSPDLTNHREITSGPAPAVFS